MVARSRWVAVAPLLFAAALGGCDSVFGPEGETRIYLSQATGSSASLSVAPDGEGAAFAVEVDGAATSADREKGGGGAVIALVDGLDVTITAVQAQQAQYVDSPDEDEGWETLTLPEPVTVDLLALPTDEMGLQIIAGDLPPGAYVRLRFLVSESELTLRAPLTIGRHTFPADEPIEVTIPSAWVKVPGAFFTVSEEEGAAVTVQFDAGTSLGQLTATGDGKILLTPVMRGKHWQEDRHWKERD